MASAGKTGQVSNPACHRPAPPPPTWPIGVGTGALSTFRLVKLYPSGAQFWTRTITKPVAGTVALALNGTPQITGWTVNTTTGLVTFAAAPAPGVAITAGFEFDGPVRFDTDPLDVTLDFERLTPWQIATMFTLCSGVMIVALWHVIPFALMGRSGDWIICPTASDFLGTVSP